MRILIVALNYAPEKIGAGRYTTQIAEHLAARGDRVRVVTTPPHYPQWKVWNGHSARRYAREVSGGVEIIRCPVWIPRLPGGWSRVLHGVSFTAAAVAPLLGAMLWRPDIVLVVAPSILAAFPALAVAKAVKARSVLQVQDLELDAAFKLHFLPGWAVKMAKGPEAWIMRRFDSVATVSREMAERIGQGRGLNRVHILRNWADIGKNDAGVREWAESRHQISRDSLVVLYSGSIGKKQDVETVLQAAGLVRKPEIEFLVCGTGPYVEKLKQKSNGPERLRFLPLQKEEEYERLLRRADIHVVTQRRGAAGSFLPSKVANICACGGALVCAADEDCELAETVRSAGGMVCDPGEPEAFADLVDELALDAETRKVMGMRARGFARTWFDREAALKILESRLLSSR